MITNAVSLTSSRAWNNRAIIGDTWGYLGPLPYIRFGGRDVVPSGREHPSLQHLPGERPF